MCSKEVIALSIINPILDYDFKNASGAQIIDEIRLSVLSASEIVEFETFDEAIMFSTSGFAVIAVDGSSKMLAIGVQGFLFVELPSLKARWFSVAQRKALPNL